MITGVELIQVESVVVEDNFILFINFSDGQKKRVDLSKLMQNPPPVFEPLKNKDAFRKISVNPVGGVQWKSGADLSADYLLAT